jgi:hypothetical protein
MNKKATSMMFSTKPGFASFEKHRGHFCDGEFTKRHSADGFPCQFRKGVGWLLLQLLDGFLLSLCCHFFASSTQTSNSLAQMQLQRALYLFPHHAVWRVEHTQCIARGKIPMAVVRR